ncbi:MAG TPA: hypothetical protein VHW95_09545 [Steroidobacteraceae bacterium]|jgi:hypothetical protein|nr:hypothetical protein [Steroidobacteraceae bacterium]
MLRKLAPLALVMVLCVSRQVLAEDLLSGFLCCNMHSDGQGISDISIAGPEQHVIPVGTPIRATSYSKHHVKVVVENKNQNLLNDYSRDLPIEQFAKRYIVQDDPAAKIKTFPQKIQYAIAAGRLVRGMTREQVLMSVGYPASSDVPNLSSNEWLFWITDKVQYRVKFDDKERLADVENVVDARTMLLTE